MPQAVLIGFDAAYFAIIIKTADVSFFAPLKLSRFNYLLLAVKALPHTSGNTAIIMFYLLNHAISTKVLPLAVLPARLVLPV